LSTKLSLHHIRTLNEDWLSIAQAGDVPVLYGTFRHLYIHLDLDGKLERATNKQDAVALLETVSVAAEAVRVVANRFEGDLLEVQGSMLHVALPLDAELFECAELVHSLFDRHFTGSTSVRGWRLCADAGFTAILSSTDVHGDQSRISLSDAANRPAKFIYSQLELPETSRTLKRAHLAEWSNKRWVVTPLGTRLAKSTQRSILTKLLDDDLRTFSPTVELSPHAFLVEAAAAQIAPASSPSSPTPERPEQFFGWVMRADIDGFTARVRRVANDPIAADRLVRDILHLMKAAASFCNTHQNEIVQLPWAGDNFTAAFVFSDRHTYQSSRDHEIIDAMLAFHDHTSMHLNTLGEWAYSLAGGLPANAAKASLYIAGVGTRLRRYLVGAGEGFGRSNQAFADTNPNAGECVALNEDVASLRADYRHCFATAPLARGGQSSIFQLAQVARLARSRIDHMSATSRTRVTTAQGPTTVSPKPWLP